MTAGPLFALTVALGTACSVMTGVTSSTSAGLGISTTEVNSSSLYSDSSSYYSYSYSYSYDLHPDYPDCDSSYALSWIDDGSCDTSLNVASCGWDGGDCCACTCNSNSSFWCTYDYYCKDPSAPLYLGDLGCQNTAYQVPHGTSCPEDQVYRVVNSTADATTLAEATLCSGGYFEVEWMDRIDVITTIYVLNGTHLHITGFSDAVADGGGAVQIFFVYNGSLYLNNIRVVNGAGSEGGAIILDADSELFADGVSFSSNTATNMGGAVYTLSSTIELVSTTFDGNSARNGGAMFVHDSVLVGSGNTTFIGNNVSENGGALYITGNSFVGWNALLNEPVIDFPSSYPSSYSSSWYDYNAFWTVMDDSGETAFLNNSAGESGGAIYADDSEVSSSGITLVERNKAWSGGALYLENGAIVTTVGMAVFALNDAIFDGGAIGATGDGGDFIVNGTTFFSNNTSGGNGGAIDLTNIDFEYAGSLSFSNNSAVFGGALYASQLSFGPTLIGVTFSDNTAEYGGAVFLSAVGTYSFYSSYYNDLSSYYYYASFYGCRFDGNSASSTGGAIHSAAGNDYIVNSTFVGNSAEIGGGMSVSGTLCLLNSSFEDNKSGDGGGPAISNGGEISEMFGIVFSGNGYHCPTDAFMDLDEATADDNRFEIVCDGCDIDCEGCTIEDNHKTPVCSDLLDHTDSKGGISTLETLDLDPGYWRATNTSRNILACFNKKACTGGLTGDPEYCLTGYEGPYCAVCSQGYVRTLSHRCSKCSSETSFGPAVLGVSAGLAGVLLMLFLYYMIRIETGRATQNSVNRFKRIIAVQSLKIIIVSWQIVTQFSAVANVVYPSLYQDLLDVVALVNFDFSWLLSAGCLDVDFYAGLITATAGPATVLALLGLTYTIALRRNCGPEVMRRIVRRKHINAIILVAFLVYSSASSAVFRTFACDSLDDGNVYLRADYRIECDSSKHRAFQIYSGLMIIVYPLGIPVFFAILLFRNRQFLENVTLRTYNGELVQQSTSSLWKPYKPSIFYYEVVECARRLVLAGIVVFIYPDTAAQIAVTLAMAFIFALTSERLNPYDSNWDGWVARIGHVMVVLTMFVALLTKVDVSDEGTQSQNMFAGILVTSHIAMILTGVTEAILLIYTVQQNDSPLPRPRGIAVLPVDSFSSIRHKHGDKGWDNEDSQGKLDHE